MSPPPPADNLSEYSSGDEEEHIPTVEDLAKSFIREEPEAEIRELEQELESQSAYLQESVSSSDDGDDESTAGMGAPLALPAYLRNILNTALDRLKIIINNVDIEVQDQFPSDASNASKEDDDPHVALNFHVGRIAIDSVTASPRVDIETLPNPERGSSSKIGKRRMRVENVFARLISDADNFVSMSRISRSTSPADTRSEVSSSQKSQSEPSISHASVRREFESAPVPEDDVVSPQASIHDLPSIRDLSPVADPQPEASSVHRIPLASSIHTIDDDRFADATSDDGMDRSATMDESQASLPAPDMSASSILYDDEGLLDYAAQNNLLDSRVDDPHNSRHFSEEGSNLWGMDGASSSRQERHPPSQSASATSQLLSVSALGQEPASAIPNDNSPSQSRISEHPWTDNLDHARHHLQEEHSPEQSTRNSSTGRSSHSRQEEDLSESKIFSHDDAESMYMSALSAAPSDSSHRPDIPGGWDSSSSASSRDTEPDTSGPIPEAMVASSILRPQAEADDGCETPRPGSRQSMFSSPHETGRASAPDHVKRSLGSEDKLPLRLAKLFLTVDEITVWFPLGLGEEQPRDETTGPTPEESGFDFRPPNLADDSIFQEMPGAFSSYAHSTSLRKASLEEAARRRPNLRSPPVEKLMSTPPKPTSQEQSAAVSIEVGTVVSHIDLATGRIMFQMLNRALTALTSQVTQGKESVETRDASVGSKTRFNFELSVKRFGIAWFQRLFAESIAEGTASYTALDPSSHDSILRIGLSSIHVASQSGPEKTRTKLEIGKFVLSSLDQDIIAFQSPRPKSRRTVGNAPEQLMNDVEIDYEQAKDRRITVVTRPVKVMFDMQKLDEALGSFGGFSGVLELSNSITSNTMNSPVLSPTPPRPRGVHFRDTPAPVPQASQSSLPKIHVQFGEVTFVLKGKSCAMQLQTTSVRLAVRESNLRLKVSEVQLSGPYVEQSQIEAPLMIEVKNTTVNFLFTPEEVDLTRLISMITPSKDPYENDEDILIDTLLRQRRKGSVFRAEVGSVGVRVSDIAQLKTLEALGAELAKLSKVTKYLPDDDRPGILTLAMVQQLDVSAMINERLGDVSASVKDASIAHVGVPALFAAEVGKAAVHRGDEVLVHEVVRLRAQDQLPMIMMRIIGDEMEPVVKAKLFNLCTEYRVSTIMAALGISDDGTVDDIALGLASSVATITGASSPKSLSRQSSASASPSSNSAKPLHIDLLLRSCALGLNPRKFPAKGLFVLTDAHFLGKQSKRMDYSIEVELRKASIHAIDDVARLEEKRQSILPSSGTTPSHRHLQELHELGYVSLSSISAAKVLVSIQGDGKDQPQLVDVEFKNELFVLESCADSTQTLIAVLNGLQPPTPPSTAERYRTIVPLQQMMQSFSGDAISAPEGGEDDNFMENADLVPDEVPTNLEFVGSFYNQESLPTEEELGDSMLGEDDLGALATPPVIRQRGDRGLLESFQEQYEVAEGEQEFDFNEDYFKDSDSEHKGKARKWDSTKNQYHLTNEFKVPNAPLKVRIRDMNIIWNLFDGYDWPRTRSIIAQAVDDVEARAEERRRKPREEDEDDDFVEEDFLFNSVWIGVPIKDEKGALARQINRDIDDQVSETGSYATSTATRSTGATVRPRSITKSRRRLKLERSKHKKIAFQLMGVAVDLVVYPPDTGETVNSVDVRVQDFEIYDHVPSSTWKKFVTCLIEPSQREMNRPMIDLELLTVKPVTDLAASELVIRVTVLPLRLHVDQDALDFITRFFEFKDDTALDSSTPSEQPFIQRLEVNAVTLKLDYKPKRVDYRGLRSGHTTEFMNFLILDGSDIILRHAIVYGITSFDKLHKTLNDVWMPDVKRNQLPGVLSGLAAVRPLVNVGSGVRDLVVVPMREYKKDGRIVRSLQKGVYAFATNTTSEVARLGAKVAIGAQNILEGAEKFLNPDQASPGRGSSIGHHDWDGEDPSCSDSEEPRAVSNYAHQPIGVRVGLRSAARSLERDLLTARDAVIAIPSEVMETGTGAGMAKAIARRAPTIILRPAIGTTKAVSNALLGVGNALDAQSRRKIDDVSYPLIPKLGF